MLHAQSGHMQAHPYQSDWWQWPLMLRPMWYLFEKVNGRYEAVLLIGNPAIYWGGLIIAAVAASGWLRRRSVQLQAALGIYVFSLAVWILIPKQIGFFYYSILRPLRCAWLLPAFWKAMGNAACAC